MKVRIFSKRTIIEVFLAFAVGLSMALVLKYCSPDPILATSKNKEKQSFSVALNDSIRFEDPGIILPQEFKSQVVQVPREWIRRDSLIRDSLQKVRFRKITRIVNGGYIGWEHRLQEWIRIKKILGDSI